MRTLPVVAMAVVMTVAGCSRCGQKTAAVDVPVERVLPAEASGIVVVPSMSLLGERVRVLESLKVASFIGQLQGFSSPAAFSDALVGQLGIDVRDVEAMRRAGVDARRGFGIALMPSGVVVVAMPVSDEMRFGKAVETVATQRFGASVRGEKKFEAVTVTTFSAAPNQPPALSVVLVGSGFALIARGAGHVDELGRVATVKVEASMSGDAALRQSLSRLPSDRLVFAYARPGSQMLKGYPLTSAAAAVQLSPSGLTISLDAPWAGDSAALGVLEKKQATSLLGYVPKDAFLTLRYQGDPASLAPVVSELVGPYVTQAFADGGIDVKSEILDQITPGAVVALSLADKPPMDKGMPQLDFRTTNPFSYAHLSGAALMKSGQRVMPLLDKIAAVAPKFGATMTKVERNGSAMIFTTYRAGEGVHFAPKGDVVFFGSPVQRIDELEAVDPEKATSAPVPSALGNEALAVVVDLHRLAQSVRELPSSAWGLGGFAIKATTVRWLDATDDLQAVTLTASSKANAIQARFELVFAQKKLEP